MTQAADSGIDPDAHRRDELRSDAEHLRRVGVHYLFPVGQDKRPFLKWRNGGTDWPKTKPDDNQIAAGLESFVQVGSALAEIRDTGLYLDHFPTFEAYCRERWNLSRQYAYQVMDAATVTNQMSAIADITNESQARAVAPILRDHGPDVQADEVLNCGDEDGLEPPGRNLKQLIVALARLSNEAAMACEVVDAFDRGIVTLTEAGFFDDFEQPELELMQTRLDELWLRHEEATGGVS